MRLMVKLEMVMPKLLLFVFLPKLLVMLLINDMATVAPVNMDIDDAAAAAPDVFDYNDIGDDDVNDDTNSDGCGDDGFDDLRKCSDVCWWCRLFLFNDDYLFCFPLEIFKSV